MIPVLWAPVVKLSDLLEGGHVSYGIVQPGADTSDGVPILRVKDIRDGRISTEQPLRVDPAISARHARTLLVGGELVISLVGTVGEAAVVPKSLAGWNVARAVAVVRPQSVSSEWLRLAFATSAVREQVTALLNTTVQSTLNLSDLKRIDIPMPVARDREAIVEVLGALDDKIAANTKLASTADRLAREIYRSIVRGAGVAPLSSTARFVNGRAFTKGATGTGRVVVRIAELNSGISGSTVYNDIVVASENVARPGDLLFAWSGSLTLHRWYRDEAIVNQHIFKVIPNVEYPMWLVNQLVLERLDEFKSIAADKATTMGHIQRRHLDEPVRVPSRDLIAANDVHMDALWNRALVAERENLTLAATRDTLLPQLVSGKLRVRDAERIVSEVA
ncbi:hypothetical protein EQW78_01610 [Oerskovia turbata]|uniref:Type I restriction modification DNA specificity domain-containing protein n=1 Tax=Oerskovia turbata TaxID=1713 RepID=A0A4Q1L1G6_9CELL|nr:hypothetical protein EQW73_08550 [Oerskovia turbata]RXR36534.1 hypothetical protein EQW78_01610 [Oerskovia turbata]TGJ97547.1 hypothetical protein DLJ96_06245 [Actinotalea fermentans ATCC 43279 = JCM 9966 = DSM 3133]